MFAIRKGNTITIAPLEDALVGLESGWAIRFADKPQFLFRISRKNLDGSKMIMDQAIANCARIARREGLDLRSNACDAQVFELATDGEHKACELLAPEQDAIARIAAKSGKCGVCGGDHKDYMVHGAALPTRKLPDCATF